MQNFDDDFLNFMSYRSLEINNEIKDIAIGKKTKISDNFTIDEKKYILDELRKMMD